MTARQQHTPEPEYRIEHRMGNAGVPGRRAKPVYAVLRRVGPDAWSVERICWSRKVADEALADMVTRAPGFEMPHLRRYLSEWASDQREREAWGDADKSTYRFRANVLESAIRTIDALAGLNPEAIPALVEAATAVMEAFGRTAGSADEKHHALTLCGAALATVKKCHARK